LVNKEIIYLKIKELILLLLQTDVASSIVELYSYLFSPQKATILEVVDAHVFNATSIDQLAFLCNMSLSTFKREFKKHFDDSPAQYIRNKRLKKATELLKHTTLSIAEISFKIGYEDSSYFSKLFFKTFQKQPSEFRKEQQS
jgi:transcriptional regulator GlxA family with amidase domain